MDQQNDAHPLQQLHDEQQRHQLMAQQQQQQLHQLPMYPPPQHIAIHAGSATVVSGVTLDRDIHNEKDDDIPSKLFLPPQIDEEEQYDDEPGTSQPSKKLTVLQRSEHDEDVKRHQMLIERYNKLKEKENAQSDPPVLQEYPSRGFEKACPDREYTDEELVRGVEEGQQLIQNYGHLALEDTQRDEEVHTNEDEEDGAGPDERLVNQGARGANGSAAIIYNEPGAPESYVDKQANLPEHRKTLDLAQVEKEFEMVSISERTCKDRICIPGCCFLAGLAAAFALAVAFASYNVEVFGYSIESLPDTQASENVISSSAPMTAPTISTSLNPSPSPPTTLQPTLPECHPSCDSPKDSPTTQATSSPTSLPTNQETSTGMPTASGIVGAGSQVPTTVSQNTQTSSPTSQPTTFPSTSPSSLRGTTPGPTLAPTTKPVCSNCALPAPTSSPTDSEDTGSPTTTEPTQAPTTTEASPTSTPGTPGSTEKPTTDPPTPPPATQMPSPTPTAPPTTSPPTPNPTIAPTLPPEWKQVGGTFTGSGGFDVAIAGDFMLSTDPTSIGGVGQARLYTQNPSWATIGAIVDVNVLEMGSSVDVAIVSGQASTVVGAKGTEDENELASFGSASYFELNSTGWSQLGSVIRPPFNLVESGGQFGSSVAMATDIQRIAVGAPESNLDGANLDTGRIYTYDFDGSEWQQMTDPLIGSAGNKLGSSMDMSKDGSHLLAGAPEGRSGDGLVYYYKWDAGAEEWDEVLPIFGSDSEALGSSVAIISDDGSQVAFGGPNYGNNQGIVRVYANFGGLFAQLGSDIVGSTNERIGTTLSGAQGRIALGTDNGSFRVYEYNGSWTQIATGPNLESAVVSIDMDEDGNRVVVGLASEETLVFELA